MAPRVDSGAVPLGWPHAICLLVNGEVQPEVFVDLGTHTGNSYFSFCQAVRDESLTSRCYAVDTWKGDEQAGSYEDRVYDMVNRHNESQYKNFSTLYRMTFDEALGRFQDRSVDLLHIDGLHTYDAVRHSFEAWLPKLAPGAIVLFHDIEVYGGDFGVWRFWGSLKRSILVGWSSPTLLGLVFCRSLERINGFSRLGLRHYRIQGANCPKQWE